MFDSLAIVSIDIIDAHEEMFINDMYFLCFLVCAWKLTNVDIDGHYITCSYNPTLNEVLFSRRHFQLQFIQWEAEFEYVYWKCS